MAEVTSQLTVATVRGEVVRMIYTNPDNGYCVCALVGESRQEMILKGILPGLEEGRLIEASGIWESHSEYGRQLRVREFRYVLPSTAEGMKRYLASGFIPGIGEKIAAAIVDTFGEKTAEVLDKYSARLKEVPGLGKKKIAALKEAWDSRRHERDALIFLQGLGITPAYCRKLFATYGDRTIEVVRSNPYQLAEDVNGIGFLKADAIAREMGIQPDANMRLLAGMVFALNTMTFNGNVGYPPDLLVNEAAKLLHVETVQAEKALQEALQRHLVIADLGLIYSPALYRAECDFAVELDRLLAARKHYGEKLLAAVQLETKFSEEQLAAVERVAASPVSVITGGPGVGKTTVIGEIVRRAHEAKIKVSLAAPTGRAAKRLSESCGITARTIHRLLIFDPASGGFQVGRDEPLDVELLIVDEVSMLDLQLAVSLLKAIPNEATLVMVGDVDQLPSVGPGTVLRSLIESNRVPVSRLTRIFRQQEQSEIILNAHRVNAGLLPENFSGDGKIHDFYWIEQDDPARVVELILKLTAERIPGRFGFDPVSEIQVLTPMNRGICGAINLNSAIQAKLNGSDIPAFQVGERSFKVGDKVMQIANDYEKGVLNGDFGIISRADFHERKFSVTFDEARQVEYEFDAADALVWAYAVTVHKSQGSEFPVVILPILFQHFMMLQRNLLYTAMTRAKKLLILIGSSKAVAMAVNNVRRENRFSALTERLKEGGRI